MTTRSQLHETTRGPPGQWRRGILFYPPPLLSFFSLFLSLLLVFPSPLTQIPLETSRRHFPFSLIFFFASFPFFPLFRRYFVWRRKKRGFIQSADTVYIARVFLAVPFYLAFLHVFYALFYSLSRFQIFSLSSSLAKIKLLTDVSRPSFSHFLMLNYEVEKLSIVQSGLELVQTYFTCRNEQDYQRPCWQSLVRIIIPPRASPLFCCSAPLSLGACKSHTYFDQEGSI